MTSQEVREGFLKFMKERGHAVVPSSSLIPNDTSVLLTTAGMQQFKPYFTGDADAMRDFGALSTATLQKSFRTSDIEEVGDDSHNTFFEMMGNFSFGGYFKKEAITFAHEYITKVVGLPIAYVTYFGGSDTVPKDIASRDIWTALGIVDIREQGMGDVFWGPTGNSGPCGPTTEIYIKNAKGDAIEIWNLVFNEYIYPGTRDELLSRAPGKALQKLKTPGVDTGMGFERLLMVIGGFQSSYETDVFLPLMDIVKQIPERERRIVSDHIRAAVFLVGDGVLPSNTERGYVLRRLIRRVSRILYQQKMEDAVLLRLIAEVATIYMHPYPHLQADAERIEKIIFGEHQKFYKALTRGIGEFEKIITKGTISGKDAFDLYQSYGFPMELTRELATERGIRLDEQAFQREFQEHQEKSKVGSEKKFGGHGLILNTGELKAANEEEMKKVIRLHTATHLLQAALRNVLGPDVKQMGSDITAERTRFDFSFPRKLAQDELTEVERLVNEVIAKDYVMTSESLPYEEAKHSGALYFFRDKYPDVVSVYTVHDQNSDDVFSKEFCGGPHVTHTSEIGKFVILKEEASSAGVRRIRATVN